VESGSVRHLDDAGCSYPGSSPLGLVRNAGARPKGQPDSALESPYMGAPGIGRPSLFLIHHPGLGYFVVFSDDNPPQKTGSASLLFGGIRGFPASCGQGWRKLEWLWGLYGPFLGLEHRTPPLPDMKFDLPLGLRGLGCSPSSTTSGRLPFYGGRAPVWALVALLLAKHPGKPRAAGKTCNHGSAGRILLGFFQLRSVPLPLQT